MRQNEQIKKRTNGIISIKQELDLYYYKILCSFHENKIISDIRQYGQIKKRINKIININNNNQIGIAIKIFAIFMRIKLFWRYVSMNK